MAAARETVMGAVGVRAVRGSAARDGQPVGRHERRPRLVEAGEHPTRATRATRASAGRATSSRATRATHPAEVGGTHAARSRRHAARPGWIERARRLAGQARDWWTEGSDRVAARARERWAEQVTAQRAATAGDAIQPAGRRIAAVEPGGDATQPSGRRVAAVESSTRPQRAARQGGASVGRRTHATPDPRPRHLAAAGATRRATWSEDLVTGWCSLLLVLGLYLGGWNHLNRSGDGPVLTPWHGLLYLGFAATAGWILTRHQRRGAWSLRAVPPGYRLALVGVGLAMVAVAGDAVWHTLYGVEQGLARLVSPFHLVLFAGASLLVSSALRAAWSGPSSARVPGLRAFWPVVLSTTLVVAMTAFFFQYVSPVVAWRRPALAGLAAGSPFAETVQVYELLGLLVHNLLFIAPVLLLLLRWQTPLGTFTVMAGSVALLLATQTELGLVGLVGAAVLGGTAADVAVTLLRPSPQRRWAARTVAVIAPAVYWSAHFALLKVGYGVSWELEIWLGSVVWACLSGLTLALLMWPPAVPLTAWNRGRGTSRSKSTPTPMPARMVGR
jgi:hypothetical protein